MRTWAALSIFVAACGGTASLVEPSDEGNPSDTWIGGGGEGADASNESEGDLPAETDGVISVHDDSGLPADASVADSSFGISAATDSSVACTTCVKLRTIDFDYSVASTTAETQGFAIVGSQLYWAGYSGFYATSTDGLSFVSLKGLPGCNAAYRREFVGVGDTLYFRELPYDTVNGINAYAPAVRRIRPAQTECELVSGPYGQMRGFFVDPASTVISAMVRYDSEKVFSVLPNGTRETLVDKSYVKVGASDANAWYGADNPGVYRIDRSTHAQTLIGTGATAIVGVDANWIYGITLNELVRIPKSAPDPYKNPSQIVHAFPAQGTHVTFFGEEVIYATSHSIVSVNRASGVVSTTNLGDRSAFRVVADANNYYFVEPLQKIGYGYSFDLYRVTK